jgi:ubiquinone/menaquinone biosynthesis C-methylase UbiE
MKLLKILSHKNDELIPPVYLMCDGTRSKKEFISVGEGFTRYFVIDHARLKPYDNVLDVGCGVGQKARVLTSYLNKKGRYEGFDIISDAIEWCIKSYQKYNNFNFQFANIYNSHYNPNAICKAIDYRFPYPDNTFDLIILSSVFTHMLPLDMKNYFEEISRVLKSGGKCVITFFLLNPETKNLMALEKNRIKIPFEYESETCRIADKISPEKTVAHDEKNVRRMFEQNGLHIIEMTYGSWSGRKEMIGSLQDVIIAIK